MIDEFVDLSFTSKQKKKKKIRLNLFYDETIGIEPANKDQEKDIEGRKVAFGTASNIYNIVL